MFQERKMKIVNWITSKKLTLLFVILFTGSAFGQETTGGIEGSVKDSAGAVVPNVTVTITTAQGAAGGVSTTGIGAGFRRTVTTDSSGFFRVLQVPPGTYNIGTGASSGFGEAKYENVIVAIGQNTQLNIVVNPGGTANTVDVTASDSATIDTTNNAIQTSFSAAKDPTAAKGRWFHDLSFLIENGNCK